MNYLGYVIITGGAALAAAAICFTALWFLAPALLARVRGAAAEPAAAPAEPVAENQVTVADRMYSPKSLTISVGDTVTWVFADRGMAHNVVADDNSFRSQLMETGQFTHTFDKRAKVLKNGEEFTLD